MHPNPSIDESYFLAPATIWKFLKAKFVSVVMWLSKDVGILLQVRVFQKEAAKPPVQMMKIRICLPLILFWLQSIRHIGQDLEILEIICNLTQPVPDVLEIAMIEAQYLISLLGLEIH